MSRNRDLVTATLTRIIADTRSRLAQLRARRGELEARASRVPPPPAWGPALLEADVTIIAEIKRRSPSAGTISSGLDAGRCAQAYASGGARAISVLTEGAHFGGSLEDLASVRSAVAVPILRKDFIIDEVQLFESLAYGASAVLLIVRALDQPTLISLSNLARELGLARLVEVHSLRELERALALEPDSIGVNSRDLETFSVDLKAVERVLKEVPGGIPAVAESGITNRADVETVAAWGADAVLVGTLLAGARDPEAAVSELVGVARLGRG